MSKKKGTKIKEMRLHKVKPANGKDVDLMQKLVEQRKANAQKCGQQIQAILQQYDCMIHCEIEKVFIRELGIYGDIGKPIIIPNQREGR